MEAQFEAEIQTLRWQWKAEGLHQYGEPRPGEVAEVEKQTCNLGLLKGISARNLSSSGHEDDTLNRLKRFEERMDPQKRIRLKAPVSLSRTCKTEAPEKPRAWTLYTGFLQSIQLDDIHKYSIVVFI